MPSRGKPSSGEVGECNPHLAAVRLQISDLLPANFSIREDVPGVRYTEDAPSQQGFAQTRALMIDSARNCFSIQMLHHAVDVMAALGFNRLHWHLTDDSAWRLPIPQFPKLTEVGAHLGRSEFRGYQNVPDGTAQRAADEAAGRWNDGFYTREQIRSVIEHAATHGIDVLPEVDIPGHCRAAVTAYPYLARAHANCPDALENLLWPHRESIDFIENVLATVLEVFPSEYIHIGGDECDWKQWEDNPQIAELVAQGQWRDGRDIQRWFTHETIDFLTRHGRKVVVWDEVCSLGVERDYLAVLWEGALGSARIEADDCPFIFADARSLYLNRIDPQAAYPQKGMTPAIGVADILSREWPLYRSQRCCGIQSSLWSEFILDEADFWDLALPRLVAVAARLRSADPVPGELLKEVEQRVRETGDKMAAILRLFTRVRPY